MAKPNVVEYENVQYYSLSTAAKLLKTTVKKLTEIAGKEYIEFHKFKENGPMMVKADDVKRIMLKLK